jgi:hypothetical protein
MNIKHLMGDLETIKHKNLVKLGKFLAGGESVIFTATESEILLILMNNFGMEVPISTVCTQIFGRDITDGSHAFRVHIHRIRKGLKTIDKNYNLSYRNDFVCLQHLQPFDKINDLKNSLHKLLSNEQGLKGKDKELLELLSKN